MKLTSVFCAAIATIGLAATAAMPAEARHAGGGGGGGGHSGGHSGGHVAHIARSAPAIRSAPALRVAPAVRSAPRAVATHRVAEARHGARHHRRGGGYVTYIDEGPYYDDSYVSDDCGWLLRKARATGKRSWWNRYYECIEE